MAATRVRLVKKSNGISGAPEVASMTARRASPLASGTSTDADCQGSVADRSNAKTMATRPACCWNHGGDLRARRTDRRLAREREPTPIAGQLKGAWDLRVEHPFVNVPRKPPIPLSMYRNSLQGRASLQLPTFRTRAPCRTSQRRRSSTGRAAARKRAVRDRFAGSAFLRPGCVGLPEAVLAGRALLMSPWPESLFAVESTWLRLAERTHGTRRSSGRR